jgi:hypothetical protein
MEVDNGNASLEFNNQIGQTVLSLRSNGKVGINQKQAEYTLDVNGEIGMHGRVGTLKQGTIPADGKWHPIITDLTGCHALEVVAGVGKKKTGKYSLIHAFALSTFGKSRNRIKVNQAYYGVRCNKLQLRWTGDTYSYQLEMRTRCSFDADGAIVAQYQIGSLWFDAGMDGSVIY